MLAGSRAHQLPTLEHRTMLAGSVAPELSTLEHRAMLAGSRAPELSTLEHRTMLAGSRAPELSTLDAWCSLGSWHTCCRLTSCYLSYLLFWSFTKPTIPCSLHPSLCLNNIFGLLHTPDHHLWSPLVALGPHRQCSRAPSGGAHLVDLAGLVNTGADVRKRWTRVHL